MKSLLLCIAVTMMFSGGQSYSESRSCSTINGKTICNSERGSGNIAGSSASALNGNGRSYQDSYAMTGDSGTGQGYASRSQRGYPPNGGFGPSFGPYFGPQGSSSGPQGPGNGPQGSGYGPQDPSYGSRGPSNANNGAYSGAQAGAGSGPMPNYGFDPFAFAGLPNPLFGGGGAFAFAGRR